MPATTQVTLASMPEELLERILALVLLPPPPPAASTARSSASHYAPVRSSPHPAPQPNPTASLLVSRAFYRVGTPLLYRHPILRSPRQADRFAATLTARPVLGTCIRALALDGTFPALKAIVKFCPTLERLDITVDNGALVGPSPRVANQSEEERADAHVRAFCSALSKLRSVRHLVLRKNAYLTQPRSVLVLEGLADAIQLWDDLVSLLRHFSSIHVLNIMFSTGIRDINVPTLSFARILCTSSGTRQVTAATRRARAPSSRMEHTTPRGMSAACWPI